MLNFWGVFDCWIIFLGSVYMTTISTGNIFECLGLSRNAGGQWRFLLGPLGPLVKGGEKLPKIPQMRKGNPETPQV